MEDHPPNRGLSVAAVSTDTGSFQYSTTTPDTLRTAAELVGNQG